MKVATRLLSVFGFAAFVLLSACGSDDGDPIGVVGNGSIRGTVTDDVGATVASATVQLSGNEQAARSTTSDAEGVYTFADVPPGTYTLTVTPPAGFVVGAAGSASVTVAGEAQADAAAFVLDRTGSITGVVVDSSGAGVANATIALTGNAQAARSTISGADGAYTFADVRAGTYTLTVTPPAGFTVVTATMPVTVSRGAQASAAAILLDRVANGSVRGTVVDDDGVGVASAFVALIAAGEPPMPTQSGADGVYTFSDVAPGTYTLVVSPPQGFTFGGPGTASVTVASGAQADASPFILDRLTPEQIDSAFTAALGAHLQAATANNQFSGAVLVVRNGETLFEGAYGLANRAQGIPNTLLTKFRVGSMNKMLTAVAVLQLVQAGKVQLDAPLLTYLPDYPNVELASKVTLHHLLTHTGGTGDIFGPLFYQHRWELREPADYLELYGTRDLVFEPGTQWQYSNYGFMLLGAVVERVTGMRYDDYVAAHILAPAGMTATGAAPEDSVVPGRAVGYTWENGTLVSNASTLPYRGTPAGGGYSTVADFERFALAVREHRLLDPAHTELLLRAKGVGGQYAYGFIDRVVAGRRIVGHTGGDSGMNGSLAFEPDGGYVVVVLSNFDPPAATTMEAFILGALPK